ncbi:MAG TPA: hypothetical protein VM142_01700 [Acidimicrobiales bacterium]|nr:hypothetical protein [Acidimicrobiales bacterium]
MITTPVGFHEIAKRMGRTPGEIARWHATGRLPRPRWQVNNGPAWTWDTIEAWAASHNEPIRIVPRRTRRSA